MVDCCAHKEMRFCHWTHQTPNEKSQVAAGAEFQKYVDHRSVVNSCPLGALARLGLACAAF